MLLEQSVKNRDVHWSAVYRKTSWYLKNPMMLALTPWLVVMLVVIVAATFINMSPTPKNRMIVRPLAGPQIVQASPYSRVLLEVPVPVRKHPNGMPRPATRTISGKAIVTQIAPQTYQVRMVP